MITRFGVTDTTSKKGTKYTITHIEPFVFCVGDDMDKVREEYLEFVDRELKSIQDYVESCLVCTDK